MAIDKTKDSYAPHERVSESTRFKHRARSLRRDMTDAERVLWRKLRGGSFEGCKFRRQVAIEPYIVDFVCLESRLIIEADGGQHHHQRPYDIERTKYLESMGYRVLRFWNHEILNELEGVLEQIRVTLNEIPSPQPLSLRERG